MENRRRVVSNVEFRQIINVDFMALVRLTFVDVGGLFLKED